MGSRIKLVVFGGVAFIAIAATLRLLGFSGDGEPIRVDHDPVGASAPSAMEHEQERIAPRAEPEIAPKEEVTAREHVAPKPVLPDRLRGIVRSRTGERVAGATVTLDVVDLDAILAGEHGQVSFDLSHYSDEPDADPSVVPQEWPTRHRATTTTAPDGSFEFVDLPKPAEEVFALHRDRLTVDAKDFVSSEVWPLHRLFTVIELDPMFHVTGVARDDASDAPLGHGELRIERVDRVRSRFEPITTHTEPDGRYAVPVALAHGVYRFVLHRTEHGPLEVSPEVNDAYLDLEYPNYPTYTIRCVDSETHVPLSGVRVTCTEVPVKFIPQFDVDLGSTDAGGNLRVRDLRPGLTVELSVSGYLRKRGDVPNARDSTAETQYIDFELKPAGFVRGGVTDWSNKPLPGIIISVRHGIPAELQTQRRGLLAKELLLAEPPWTTTDEDGRFVLPVGLGEVMVFAIDPTGKRSSGRFPMARLERGGDAADVGVAALVDSTREAAAPVKSSSFGDTEHISVSFARGKLIEFSAQLDDDNWRFALGSDSSSDRWRVFLGYGVTDHRGRLSVTVTNRDSRSIVATHFDGFAFQDVTEEFESTRTTQVRASVPVKAHAPHPGLELSWRYVGDREFHPYVFEVPVIPDAAGEFILELPRTTRPIEVAAREFGTLGDFTALGNLAPGAHRIGGE